MNMEYNKEVEHNARYSSQYLNVMNLETGKREIVDLPIDAVQKYLLWDHRLVLLKKPILKIIDLFTKHSVKFDLRNLMGIHSRNVPLWLEIVKDKSVGHLELVLSALNSQSQRFRKTFWIIPDVL